MTDRFPPRGATLVALGVAVLASVVLTGCEGLPTPYTPRLDAQFGDAVRQARAQQTIDPEAGRNDDPVAGIDGTAAQHTIERYEKSFQEPPPTFNVLGIGGMAAP